MPRYVKQRKEFDCGPVAVLNALRWLGRPASYKEEYPKIVSLCDCNESGTDDTFLTVALCLSIDYKLIFKYDKINLTKIDKWLDAGNAIILKYFYNDKDEGKVGHYIFCPGRSACTYTIVNEYAKGPASISVSDTAFIDYINSYCGKEKACVWFIQKPT